MFISYDPLVRGQGRTFRRAKQYLTTASAPFTVWVLRTQPTVKAVHERKIKRSLVSYLCSFAVSEFRLISKGRTQRRGENISIACFTQINLSEL